MRDTLHELLFGVRRSVRYHARRRMFFDRLNLLASAVSVIFGSAAMAAMLSDLGRGWVTAAAAVVTVVSAVNLVVGSARMARLHADLARRFVDLEKAVMLSPDAADPSPLIAARLEIEADEPPVLAVLDCICHVELMQAMGYPERDMPRIRWYQRMTAQYFDIGLHAIRAPYAGA